MDANTRETAIDFPLGFRLEGPHGFTTGTIYVYRDGECIGVANLTDVLRAAVAVSTPEVEEALEFWLKTPVPHPAVCLNLNVRG